MITKTFTGFMICLYLGLGIYFLLIQTENARFSLLSFRIFGGALIIYGIFRAYRFYRSFKNKEYENEV